MWLIGLASCGDMLGAMRESDSFRDTLVVAYFIGPEAPSRDWALGRFNAGQFAAFPVSGTGAELVRDLAEAQRLSLQENGAEPVICYFEPPRGLVSEKLLDFMLQPGPSLEPPRGPHHSWSGNYDWGVPEQVTAATHPEIHAQLNAPDAHGMFVVEQWHYLQGAGFQVEVQLTGKAMQHRLPDGQVLGLKNVCMTAPSLPHMGENRLRSDAAPKVHERTVDYLFSNDQRLLSSSPHLYEAAPTDVFFPLREFQRLLLEFMTDVAAGRMNPFLGDSLLQGGQVSTSKELPSLVVREFVRPQFDLETGEAVGNVMEQQVVHLADVVGLRFRERWEIRQHPFEAHKQVTAVAILIEGGAAQPAWVPLPVGFKAQ